MLINIELRIKLIRAQAPQLEYNQNTILFSSLSNYAVNRSHNVYLLRLKIQYDGSVAFDILSFRKIIQAKKVKTSRVKKISSSFSSCSEIFENFGYLKKGLQFWSEF